ncbi:MAG: hypothetical protein E6J58_22640 [Deltaproteobacteria bacterium]|nr:MAG: hypothetical protein E6J58_22640 [Deltaproteobacteria bacterium]
MAREVKRTLATKETDHDDPGKDAVRQLEPRRPDRGHSGAPVRAGAGGPCAADCRAAGRDAAGGEARRPTEGDGSARRRRPEDSRLGRARKRQRILSTKVDGRRTARYAAAMDDRRKFHRVNAPVFCRPVGQPLFSRRKAVDVSLGGLRVYADDPPMSGDRLELELFLPDQSEVMCTVEVVWVEALPEGSPARYDVGVKFVTISPVDRERLSTVLQSE